MPEEQPVMSTTVRSMGMGTVRDPGNAGLWSLGMDITCYLRPALRGSPPLYYVCSTSKAGALLWGPWPALQVKAEKRAPGLDSPFFVSQREGEVLQTGRYELPCGHWSALGRSCPGKPLSQKASVPQGQFFLLKLAAESGKCFERAFLVQRSGAYMCAQLLGGV